MLPLSELCRSITMKLPDPLWALSEHERYRAGCSTHDFARWTDEEGREHYYLFGALDIPLAHTEGDVFNWGLWVEVEKAFHDAYYDRRPPPTISRPKASSRTKFRAMKTRSARAFASSVMRTAVRK